MISVVIPVMNEAENIQNLIPKIYDLNYPLEVLLIDVKGGSTDDTREIVKNFRNNDNYKNLNLISQTGTGFANALIEGLKSAYGEIIVTMDAENHLPEEIPLLINRLREENADVVVGSRFLKDSKVDLDKKRLIPSKIANKIARASLRLKIEDCSSGFRAYRASKIQNALENMKTRYFSVQVEILDRVSEAGGKLLEMPCTYVARESGESKYNFKPAIKDGMNILKIAKDHQVEGIKSRIDSKIDDVKEKANAVRGKTEGAEGYFKDKFKDMQIGVDMVKTKSQHIFKSKFKDKFKNKFK